MTKCLARASLIVIQVSLSKAFNINALPATVTQNQVASLTWFREQVDPTHFQLGKMPRVINQAHDVGLILPTQLVEKDQIQGTIPVTFLHSGVQLTIVAYDLSTVSASALDHRLSAKPSPFFIDSQSVSVFATDNIKNVQTTPFLSSGHNSPTATSGVNTSIESTSRAADKSKRPNIGAIVGSVVGVLFSLTAVSIIIFLKWKNKRYKRASGLNPFLTTSLPTSTTAFRVNPAQQRQNEAIIEQREYPAPQLEVYDPPSLASDTGDGILNNTSRRNEGDGTVQNLRYEVDVLKQRIATLEAGLAPPDYRSRASTM